MKVSFRVAVALALLVASMSAYYIKSFDSEIFLKEDGSYTVDERIVVNFGSEQRHGIFRDIVYKYDVGLKINKVRISVLGVEDDAGNEYKTKISRQGDRINIRIGSPDFTVSGIQIYRIRYKVEKGMLYFEDHDELYWNVTGTEWPCDIASASAMVYLPEGMPTDEIRTKCFTGPYGSEVSDCSSRIRGGKVIFTANHSFGPMEGLSIVVGMPKGHIKKPGLLKSLLWILYFIWPLIFLPIGILWILIVYLKRGRDPIKYSITPRYNPPEELSPAEAGTVVDESVDIRDMTSTIVDLAVRGYIKIIEIEKPKLVLFKSKDYVLVKLKNADSRLKKHEKTMFDGLFIRGTIESDDMAKAIELCPEYAQNKMITVSSLKEKFYVELPAIKDAIYDELVEAKLFPSRPDKVRGKYLGIGIVILVLSFPLSMITVNFMFMVSLIPIAVLTMIMSRFMPRKTRDGSIKAANVAGFEEFVRRVEKDRIERMAKEDPTIFERLLPYAMALGVEDQWANAFKDIFKSAPEWYVSHTGAAFYPIGFVNNLGGAVNSIGSAMSARPRSSGAGGGSSGFSGGGFSGGGFGGGGGGAW